MVMNLIEGLDEQMDRARELRKVYENIPAGHFGTVVIDLTIKQAERSIASGDVADMMTAYKGLEELE